MVYRVEGASGTEVASAIQQACLSFMGVLNVGKAGIMILNNQSSGPFGVIRVAHNYVDEVKASLLHITTFKEKPIAIDVVGVSGILKKARTNFIDEAYRVKVKRYPQKTSKSIIKKNNA